MKPYDLPQAAHLLEIEQQLEDEAVSIGAEVYRRKLEERGDLHTGPGAKLLRELITPMAEAVDAFQTLALSGRPGKDATKAKFLLNFKPEVIAYVTAKVAIQNCDQETSVQGAALEISQLLEDTVNMEALKEADSSSHRYVTNRINNRSSKSKSGRVIIGVAMKKAAVAKTKMNTAERLSLGLFLLRMLESSTGALLLVRLPQGKGHNTPICLEASPATREWLNKSHANAALLQPIKRPMVIPPVPWTSIRGGGYISQHLKFPAVTTRNRSLMDELKAWDMPKVYRALNALQETPWVVNKAVLKVLDEVWSTGGQLGQLPPTNDLPLPVQNYDSPEANPEAHTLWKREARDVYERNAKLRGKRFTVSQKISLAKRFSEFEAIYFPHNMDWRGRMYPVATFLNPQGDDVAKSLLKFSQGKALGPNGMYWLAVHGANCAGVDKVDFEERIKWIEDHHAQIIDSALNPLDGGRFWSTVDSPWQFLAFCFEWLGASMQGEAYVSHLSVSWDGSCNGLQNYSAMLLDEVGGKATNLIPSDTPSDIYTEVALKVESLLSPGSAWKGKVTRGITKRPTMTLPYGAGRFGFTDQVQGVLQELNEKSPDGMYLPFGDDFDNSREMAAVVDEAISRVVVKAREAMDWLKEVAKVAASDKLPIYWEAPSGFLVVQDYRILEGQRIASYIGGERIRLTLQIETDVLDTKKQAQGIAPNFIHSMDASHMVNTINRCLDKGVTSLAMIHDSYGTHAADADTLSSELREAFIEQYSGDVLGGFLEQIKGQLPPELIDKLPPRPKLGTLDISQVRHSRYFFG